MPTVSLTSSRRQQRAAIRSILSLVLTAVAVTSHAQQGFNQPPPPQPQPDPAWQGGYPPGQPTAPPNPNQPYPNGAAGMNPGQMPPGQFPNPSAMNPGQPGGPGMPNPSDTNVQVSLHVMQAVLQQEMQDYGVAPQSQLQTNLHGPTPTSIPGGQLITTDRLLSLYQQGQQNGLLVFHVLGAGPSLPMAQNAVGASQPGSFDDQTQQEFGNYLQQVTQGNKARPMVFYCQSTQCWMSYNAALRAINMGFTQVYWYRGGVEAWQAIAQASAGSGNAGGNPGGNMGNYQGYPTHYP